MCIFVYTILYICSNNYFNFRKESRDVEEINPPLPENLMANPLYIENQKKIDTSTKDILAKIAEVNKSQGLSRKKSKPGYIQFPFGFYSSQEKSHQIGDSKESKDLYSNPILEYLRERDLNTKDDGKSTFKNQMVYQPGNEESYIAKITDLNSQIEPEDIIRGQYIKRKITHYQTVVLPSPYINTNSEYPISPTATLPINGLKNVEPIPYSNSQYFLPPSNYPYPGYQYQLPFSYNAPPSDVVQQQEIAYRNNILNQNAADEKKKTSNSESVSNSKFPIVYPQMTMKNTDILKQTTAQSRQNWNWPGANLFPIYIRDPFLQMYYAVTNMVEYGPTAGNEGPCKLTPRPTRLKADTESSTDFGEDNHYHRQQIEVEINKKNGTNEVRMINTDPSSLLPEMDYLDVESLDIGNDDLIKLTLNLPTPTPTPVPVESREINGKSNIYRSSWEKLAQINNNKSSLFPAGKLDFSSIIRRPDSNIATTIPPPQITNQYLQIHQLEDEPESEKTDIGISNQGSKKLISKDNTGNGIFIHKLRVRHGGVAIAGPGGIATAGSGGTAIVGPDGIAYTHPDGLAIAGSGTKVVAVDPKIDLNEVIKNVVTNGSKPVPNTRLGKVVAIGPVIYYNKGI
ncbi:uncharacterized protein LOC115883734 [Sitophilus oryzae]|uniref:Uncharacterized protein LOC115883734 n=1 Tax=Sitophilus oryzae TaxID=7048 RepID=A0A6J2Y2F1_SITOR|nr:uncharacterized protein LOC115883734 [Sitophilus oryzae]